MVGFPHSEIPGSKLIRSSPRLIAAYYVLHRLHTPRHPLDALKTLDRSHYQCPQYHQSVPLLYGTGLHHRADAFIRSITAPVLIGQIKKNQNSRTSLCLPEGVGSNETVLYLFTMSKDPVVDALRRQTQPNLLSLLRRRSIGDHQGHQKRIGGARRDRTDDILLAKQALSQLSYGPTSFAGIHGGPG